MWVGCILEPCIEKYAYVPSKGDGKPLLSVNMQYDKVLREYFALFPVDAKMEMPRLASTSSGEALQAGAAEVIRRLPPGVPLDIYHLNVVQKKGRFIPCVTMSAPVLAHVAVRFKYAVWESGGMQYEKDSGKQEGYSQIVTNRGGAALKPAIVRQSGHLANSRHAAFSIYPKTNLVVVNASVKGEKQSIRITRVDWCDLSQIPSLDLVWEGENHNHTPNPYYDAVCAALDKANTLNCKVPMFIAGR